MRYFLLTYCKKPHEFQDYTSKMILDCAAIHAAYVITKSQRRMIKVIRHLFYDRYQ